MPPEKQSKNKIWENIHIYYEDVTLAFFLFSGGEFSTTNTWNNRTNHVTVNTIQNDWLITTFVLAGLYKLVQKTVPEK